MCSFPDVAKVCGITTEDEQKGVTGSVQLRDHFLQ